MTSCLYPITRRLFRQVFAGLKSIGLLTIQTPLIFALMAIYINGLISLERQQNSTRMANWFPGRAHDALNRLLTTHSIPTFLGLVCDCTIKA